MQLETRELFRKYHNPEEFERLVELDTIPEMWAKVTKEFSDQEALVDGKTYTYKELEEAIGLYRKVLLDNGIKQGDHVGVFAKNSFDLVKMYLAITTFGGVAAILPAHLDEKSLYGVSMMFNLKALCYEEDQESKLNVIRSLNPNCKLLSSSLVGSEPTPINLTVKKEDSAIIMFTGGTTGRSKGALLSHEAVMQGTVNGCYGMKHVFGERYLLILPLSHVFGLIRNLMTCLYSGSVIYIVRNNKDMFKDIAIFKPTILVLVPAIAEMALNLSKAFNRNMLGDSLKTIICGAARVAPYLINEYHKLGIDLYPGYGLTESANLVSGNPENLAKPDSVGIPYPHQEFKIVNDELWLKGKNMMKGYIGIPGANEEAYEDGWFKTGDLVKMDEDGFLYITGRCKEVIILSNGENVSPQEVEAVFNECSLIQDSQLYEDVKESGEHFLALEVVPRMNELQKVEVEDKMAYLMKELEKINQSLPPFERVTKIIIRDKDFERTPAMKIVRYHKC